MADINYGFLTGKIASDPVFEMKGNYPSLNFTVMSEGYSKNNLPAHVNFIDMNAKGDYAISIKDLLKKDQKVSVQYKLNYSTWQAQNYSTKQMETRKKIFITADNIIILNVNNESNF